MPVMPYAAALLLSLAGCAPRYADRGPLAPEELWTPLPLRKARVDGIDIAYVDSDPGSDDTPLVFVHGLSSYLGYWEHQIAYFGSKRRVLAIDLPGYGASDRPDAPYTPPWYADVLSRWLEELRIDQAVLVGHSMGGQVALTFALRHPDQLDRLVLSAPAGFERFNPGAAAWMKSYWHEGRALEASEDQLRATFTTVVFNKPDAGVERLLEERVRMGATPAFRGTSVAVSRCIAGMVDHPVADRLGEIDALTLVIFGSDDRMIPNPAFTGGTTRRVAEQGVAALQHAELAMIPGAGHTVHHDAPDEFNRLMAEFLGM